MSRTTDADDPRVSEAYRAIADERPPDHLDQAVMRMAGRAIRTPYAAARAWMRPVAWAAIIGLSLALVMELALLPQESLRYDAAPADIATTDGQQRDTMQPIDNTTVREDVTRSGKAPLAEPWRAHSLPAKAIAAPEMLHDTSREDVALEQQSVAREYLCPPKVRESADRWYDCIQSLREKAPPDQVAEEIEALFDAYPEFIAPSTHK